MLWLRGQSLHNSVHNMQRLKLVQTYLRLELPVLKINWIHYVLQYIIPKAVH